MYTQCHLVEKIFQNEGSRAEHAGNLDPTGNYISSLSRGSSTLRLPPSFPGRRWGGREAQEVVDARRLLEPAAEGAGEALPDAEVHHQARQEAARRQPRAHRRSGRPKENLHTEMSYFLLNLFAVQEMAPLAPSPGLFF